MITNHALTAIFWSRALCSCRTDSSDDIRRHIPSDQSDLDPLWKQSINQSIQHALPHWVGY